ncbi:unnamed protein product [Lepeophtheirus salmonis]|uniref:(salmon louse) hypothetical protein n=1 Tax=Lepeophtheirus salmonis TaxID=72036 RepID=A0A7R8CQF1_LEPSM|nr:unnamed protein product [Lepeophtheirus salmonis]CAF2895026.1 unnamed protein product [Lepeophtheirus salmonis]
MFVKTCLPFFFLTIKLSYGFFDPCQAFGICISVQPNNNRGFNVASNPAPVNFMKLDDKWIKPSDHQSDYAYYFAQDVHTGFDWFESKKFCEFNGGHLAEPMNSDDANFLRSYARSLAHNDNWWIGLREKEQCRCQFQNSFGFSSYVSLNPSELVNHGVLHVSCPSQTRKVCDGGANRWIWSFSGTPMSGYTNWAPSEPQFNEYCVILWHQRDFQWSDFSCNIRIDSDNSRFKPLCQKRLTPLTTTTTTTTTSSTTAASIVIDRVDEYDYDDKGPKGDEENDEDENDDENQFSKGDILPNSESCSDSNVVYRGRNIQRPIKLVYSSKRCAEICNSVEGCRYWVWRGDKFPQKCILKSKLRRRKFRIRKQNAVSGKRNGCPASPSTKAQPTCSLNYDVRGDNVETIGNILESKLQKNVWRSVRKTKIFVRHGLGFAIIDRKNNQEEEQNAFLSVASALSEDYFVYKKGAVTGIYPSEECYDQKKDENICECKSFSDAYYEDLDYGEYTDLNGSGRISNSGSEESEEKGTSCRKKEEYNHCPLKEKETAIEETTPEKLIQEEVCIEYGVSFNGGTTYSMIGGVTSAEQCRSHCTGMCKYWTWKSKAKSCLLKKANTYYPEANESSVSGTIIGTCSTTTPFSSLTRCSCLPVDPEYDYSEEEEHKNGGDSEGADEYDYYGADNDASFLSLITVKQGGKDCSNGYVKKCGSSAPVEIDIVNLGGSSRIHFS